MLRRQRGKRKFFVFIILIILIFVFIQFFLFIESNLRPTLIALAEARAKIIAFDAIHQSISEEIARSIRYNDLLQVEKDNEGKIAMTQINTMEVNRIQAETVRKVQSTLQSIEGEVVKIPLGQILGSQILANYGPKIPVTLVPIGTVHVDISHSFKEAGINQTRHKIYLEVFTDVQFIVPFISASRKISSAVPIADTIYMGDVPDTVLNLPFPMKGYNETGDISGFSGYDGGGLEEKELNEDYFPYFNR